MILNEAATAILTVSGILFGFLFAGFWWSLNRELSFDPDQRHFKFGHFLLVLTMGLLGYFGMVKPLNALASADPSLTASYRGIVLALIGVFGYMLTEFGHYYIFQRPKYVTGIERLAFALTLLIIVALALIWWVF
jgi:hypothetical protein